MGRRILRSRRPVQWITIAIVAAFVFMFQILPRLLRQGDPSWILGTRSGHLAVLAGILGGGISTYYWYRFSIDWHPGSVKDSDLVPMRQRMRRILPFPLILQALFPSMREVEMPGWYWAGILAIPIVFVASIAVLVLGFFAAG